jgi:hypothetical protein
LRTLLSWNVAHTVPASTSNFVTVLIETSQTREKREMARVEFAEVCAGVRLGRCGNSIF